MRRSIYNGVPIIILGKRTAPITYGLEINADSGVSILMSPSVGDSLFISGITASGTIEVFAVVDNNEYPAVSPPVENIEVDSTDIGGLFDGLVIKTTTTANIKLYGWEVVR